MPTLSNCSEGASFARINSRIMSKNVYSAGIVDHSSLVGRPFGLRQFNLDFLAITIEGKAMFLLEEKGIASEVIPVNMVYVPAGKTHLYDPDTQSGWLNCWTLFDGAAVRNVFSELIPSTGITLLKSGIEFYKYWEKLSSYMLENDDLNDESAFCVLHQILLEIKRQSRSETDSCPSTAVIETMHFVKIISAILSWISNTLPIKTGYAGISAQAF